MPRYEDVLNAALELSYEDRATLQEVLLETLHPPGGFSDEELGQLIAARLDALEQGRVNFSMRTNRCAGFGLGSATTARRRTLYRYVKSVKNATEGCVTDE